MLQSFESLTSHAPVYYMLMLKTGCPVSLCSQNLLLNDIMWLLLGWRAVVPIGGLLIGDLYYYYIPL